MLQLAASISPVGRVTHTVTPPVVSNAPAKLRQSSGVGIVPKYSATARPSTNGNAKPSASRMQRLSTRSDAKKTAAATTLVWDNQDDDSTESDTNTSVNSTSQPTESTSNSDDAREGGSIFEEFQKGGQYNQVSSLKHLHDPNSLGRSCPPHSVVSWSTTYSCWL